MELSSLIFENDVECCIRTEFSRFSSDHRYWCPDVYPFGRLGTRPFRQLTRSFIFGVKISAGFNKQPP
ncbi:hypothetical protein QVD17_32984 [Tagetes erecta]|uniref:Uncharacterized protein n=1 Tax=Tagetes erecta TaxID=13708 RepID=A0AAD8NKV3_TARER|nr:hypothetical protein QVD17_32984 [Tagetes erecta]